MAPNTQTGVLLAEVREMVDGSFYEALESIRKIHSPLQLVDRDKANRLAKLSHELAQIHREAHLDDVISSLSPTEAYFETTGHSSSAKSARPATAFEASKRLASIPEEAELDITPTALTTDLGLEADDLSTTENPQSVVAPPANKKLAQIHRKAHLDDVRFSLLPTNAAFETTRSSSFAKISHSAKVFRVSNRLAPIPEEAELDTTISVSRTDVSLHVDDFSSAARIPGSAIAPQASDEAAQIHRDERLETAPSISPTEVNLQVDVPSSAEDPRSVVAPEASEEAAQVHGDGQLATARPVSFSLRVDDFFSLAENIKPVRTYRVSEGAAHIRRGAQLMKTSSLSPAEASLRTRDVVSSAGSSESKVAPQGSEEVAKTHGEEQVATTRSVPSIEFTFRVGGFSSLGESTKLVNALQVSHEAAQIRREAQIVKTLPSGVDVEVVKCSSSAGVSESVAAPQAGQKKPATARIVDSTRDHTQDPSASKQKAKVSESSSKASASQEKPLTAKTNVEGTENQKLGKSKDKTPTWEEVAWKKMGGKTEKGKQPAVAEEPAASGSKSVGKGDIGIPKQPNPHEAGNQTESRKVNPKKDGKPNWAKNAWAKFAAEEPAPKGKQVPTEKNFGAVERWAMKVPQEPTSNEGEASQRRLVEVHGLPATSTLREVTRHITEGALMHVGLWDRPDSTKTATVIFQNAVDAWKFVLKNDLVQSKLGARHSCYGPNRAVVFGAAFPDAAAERKMSGKPAVRRRLTFSGAELFKKITPARFYLDIAAIVKTENIELAWVFDYDNATVVFSEITCAVVAMTWVRMEAPRAYQGITVSFGADPCEADLPLVSQIPGGGEITL